MESLTADDIRAHLKQQEARGVSRHSLADRWAILSTLWTWANARLWLP